MRIKKMLAIGAAGLLTLGLIGTVSACGSDDEAGDATPTVADEQPPVDEPVVPEDEPVVPEDEPVLEAKNIAMINLSLCCDYFIGMDKAVTDRANELGWTVTNYDADGDESQVLSDVETALALGVDGIVFSGAWVNDYPEALAAIEEAGVPVVMVDRLTDTTSFTAWVGPENERMGTEVGEYLANHVDNPEEAVAVIIKGGPEDNTIGIARTKGAIASFDAAGIAYEISPDFGGWNADEGKTSMENMMAKLDKIDIVFCENDDMCLGALKAAQEAGLNDIIFGAIDGSEAAKAEIATEGSKYLATGFNDPFVIGALGVDILADYFLTGSVEQMQGIDSPLLDASNVADFM